MRDLAELAELSNALERVVQALAADDPDDRRIERYLFDLAEGEQEAMAVALSYALRRRTLEGESPQNGRAIELLTAALGLMVGLGS